jgi:hypothetical protein
MSGVSFRHGVVIPPARRLTPAQMYAHKRALYVASQRLRAPKVPVITEPKGYLLEAAVSTIGFLISLFAVIATAYLCG